MANGYARATGSGRAWRWATTGPAAGNIMGAVGDAYRGLGSGAGDCQPDSLLGLIGQDRGAFHEMRDQLGMAAAVARRSGGWRRVGDIRRCRVTDAWLAMTAGRGRPACIRHPGGRAWRREGDVTIAAPSRPNPPRRLLFNSTAEAQRWRVCCGRRSGRSSWPVGARSGAGRVGRCVAAGRGTGRASGHHVQWKGRGAR